MAVPTTRSALQTRAAALRVEAAELARGAHSLAGGLDGGTDEQKRHAAALEHRLSLVDKELQPAGVSAHLSGVA